MLQFAAIFGENMILQAESHAAVWGTAAPGQPVEVCLGEQTAHVTAGEDGTFLTWLYVPAAGREMSLTARCGEECVTIYSVLSGHVFIAGGQSNMEYELRDCTGGATEGRSAHDTYLRFYTQPKHAGNLEDAPLSPRDYHWVPADGENAPYLSAVAYYFGKHLRKALGVPIGIIQCYWGGTYAACWQDEADLRALPALTVYEKEYAALYEGMTEEEYIRRQQEHMAIWRAYQKTADETRARLGDSYTPLCVDAPSPWPPVEGPKGYRRPCGLYHTMVEPISPYTAKAVLWYQGESDETHPSLYRQLFTQMVQSWRRCFRQPGLPFFTVQLAEHASQGVPDELTWGYLREAQRQAAKQPGIHMVTALGTGEWENIHPLIKAPVGQRLANCVLDTLFDIPREFTGPRLERAEITDTGATLTFTHATGMQAKGELRGLYADTPITGRISGSTLHITWTEKPTLLGYGCTNWHEGNLQNAAGFPAEAFLLTL